MIVDSDEYPVKEVVGVCLLCKALWPLGCGMSHASEHEQAHTHSESALEILKKRYARREINREEFDRIKRDLS